MTNSEPSSNIALVTGAGHRIGRTLVTRLAADGWAVGVHYRNSKDAADEIVANIQQNGGRAAALAADLGDMKDLTTLVTQCKKNARTTDLLDQ